MAMARISEGRFFLARGKGGWGLDDLRRGRGVRKGPADTTRSEGSQSRHSQRARSEGFKRLSRRDLFGRRFYLRFEQGRPIDPGDGRAGLRPVPAKTAIHFEFGRGHFSSPLYGDLRRSRSWPGIDPPRLLTAVGLGASGCFGASRTQYL